MEPGEPMRPQLISLAATATLASACVTELEVEPTVSLDPTIAATFERQALTRMLVTRADPSDASCVGVVLVKDVDDGIPGQDLAVPTPWGLESAYRYDSAAECHGVFPQDHRVRSAMSGSGFVDWAPGNLTTEGAPRAVQVDIELWFDRVPYVMEIIDDSVSVEIGAP